MKVLVRQFARNVRQLRRILFKQELFQQMLGLEISLLNSGDCETVETELGAIYSVMESNSLNSLLLSTYTIKFSLLENIETLLASKFSFRFWRMLPVWLRNVERIMYGYEVLGSAGRISNKINLYLIKNIFEQKFISWIVSIQHLHQPKLRHQHLQLSQQCQQRSPCRHSQQKLPRLHQQNLQFQPKLQWLQKCLR